MTDWHDRVCSGQLGLFFRPDTGVCSVPAASPHPVGIENVTFGCQAAVGSGRHVVHAHAIVVPQEVVKGLLRSVAVAEKVLKDIQRDGLMGGGTFSVAISGGPAVAGEGYAATAPGDSVLLGDLNLLKVRRASPDGSGQPRLVEDETNRLLSEYKRATKKGKQPALVFLKEYRDRQKQDWSMIETMCRSLSTQDSRAAAFWQYAKEWATSTEKLCSWTEVVLGLFATGGSASGSITSLDTAESAIVVNYTYEVIKGSWDELAKRGDYSPASIAEIVAWQIGMNAAVVLSDLLIDEYFENNLRKIGFSRRAAKGWITRSVKSADSKGLAFSLINVFEKDFSMEALNQRRFLVQILWPVLSKAVDAGVTAWYDHYRRRSGG